MVSPDYSMLHPAFHPSISQVEIFKTAEPLKPLFPMAVPPSKYAVGDGQKFRADSRDLTPQIVPAAKSLAERVVAHNSQLKINFLQISVHLEPRWRDRIFSQLDRLVNPEDWDEDEVLPDFASYDTLLRLVLFVRPRRVPGLGLSDDGNLVASWSDENDHLTAECLPHDQIRWSLLINTGGAPQSAAGNATIVRIREELAAFRPQRWLQG